MSEKPICEIPKNSREIYQFRLGEFKGHKFVDMRIYSLSENGNKTLPTKKGVTVAPALWPEFRRALDQVEAAMIEQGLIDREDLGE